MNAKTENTATKVAGASSSKAQQGEQDAPTTLVPKLRFPEFRGAEGWTQLRLIDTADRTVKWSFIGGPFGSNLKSSDYVADGVRIIQLQNIGDGEFWADYRIFTSFEKADELLSNNIYPGDIIMSKMGDPVGRACLIPELHDRYVMCSDGIRLVVNEKENEKYFIYSLINSPPFRSVVEKTATGSTRKRIGLDELKNLPMWLPKKPEQEKIAECLSSLDELMAAQARKVDALKTHKKGLMQQLFPTENVSGSEKLEVKSEKGDQNESFSLPNSHFSPHLPRLRFPEFQTAGEWDSKPLGELGEIITGKTPSTKEADLWGGDILFITPTDISEDGKYQHTAARTVVETKSTKVLPAGSIVYTCIASIGKMALTVTPSITNQQINAVVPNKRALGEFLYYALANLTPWIKIIPATNTLPIINKTDFSKIAILHPGKDEQQRIADCLSSLDALITAETRRLSALKTHKKGLMQQLFPSLEEVEI